MASKNSPPVVELVVLDPHCCSDVLYVKLSGVLNHLQCQKYSSEVHQRLKCSYLGFDRRTFVLVNPKKGSLGLLQTDALETGSLWNDL